MSNKLCAVEKTVDETVEEVGSSKASKLNLFTGYLLGFGIILIIILFSRMPAIISNAKEMFFTTHYSTSDELIAHGIEHLKSGETYPCAFSHENVYEGIFTKLKLSEDGTVITGTVNEVDNKDQNGDTRKELSVPLVPCDTERVEALLHTLPMRTDIYTVESDGKSHYCYLFDFQMTKAEFMDLFNGTFFFDGLDITDSEKKTGYIAIDRSGYIVLATIDDGNELLTINFRKKGE